MMTIRGVLFTMSNSIQLQIISRNYESCGIRKICQVRTSSRS